MDRRRFLQISTVSSALLIGSDLYQPKKTDAFLLAFLGGGLLEFALGGLLQGAFSLAMSAWGRRSQEWYDARLSAQVAQSNFLENRFSNSANDMLVARVNRAQGNYIIASQRREELGYNVALSFPQERNGVESAVTFSGPATIGMASAAMHLKEVEGLSDAEIRAAILPMYRDYDDWNSWSQSTSFTTYRTQASQDGVMVEYRAGEKKIGGTGNIYVTVQAHRNIEIHVPVQYA